ncbi:MAG: gliding motility-associated C-terminal domain-containing protein [Bacteroidia bacterium]|nr:gliding motility-associated C-terminal domain-containing protein [Bacteroidia bacterium]
MKQGSSAFEFIENKGQFHPLAKYKTRIPNGNLYLEGGGILYDLFDSDDYHRIQQWKHDHPAQMSDEVVGRHAVRIKFKGVQYAPKSISRDYLDHYYNYFLGSNSDNWVSKVYPSSEVVYKDVYPGIDFEINGAHSVKYQWVVRNPTYSKVSQIQSIIEGADSIKIENQQLKIFTSVGVLIDDIPYAYQVVNGTVNEVPCTYKLRDSTVSFSLLESINPDYPLIIDPKLIFSTYSGSLGDNFGFTATYDSKGNLYAGGIVDAFGNLNYPVTPGAFQTNFGGGSGVTPANLPCDISLSKYDSAGSKLLWATYLGGAEDEYPHSLVVDRNDDLLVFGTSFSMDYPYSNNGYDTTHSGGTDIIVTKLSEDGSVLIGSTFIGGKANDGLNQNLLLKHNYADDFRGDIITDDDGNIFVATCTLSDSLPLKDEIQIERKGGTDGYIFQLSGDCSELLWGTYLGGTSSDALYSIKLDQFNNIYVGGGSASGNLPGSQNVIYPNKIGDVDGIISIFSKEDKSLKKLTYWGTPSYDQIYFIDIDSKNRIYATGQTEGSISQTSGTYGGSNYGQFIFRIDTLLETVDFQTTFGNRIQQINLAPSAFLVDVCDHIYFSGWGSIVSPNNPGSTQDMEVTSDAEQVATDSNDFYILVLDKDASGLLYATYFGGDITDDHVDGGTSRFDKKGVIYQSVCSSCPPARDGQTTQVSDFPTSVGAAFETNPSIRCSNASFKIDLQIKTAVIADFIANPNIGCNPLNVQFTNRSILGETLLWEFGDGDTSTEINPTHTYIEPGLFTVRLTVIDSNTCNISSIYERQILVIEQSITDFAASYDVCKAEFELVNNSQNALTYNWYFGDGNTSTDKTPKHEYSETGTYSVKLVVNEGMRCESSDSQEVVISGDAKPEITLYNVFTPNGDGLNDCFWLDGINLECSEYELKIFNRWGEKVFHSFEINECWNGNVFNTKQVLPGGTYFYIVNLGKNSVNLDTYSGTITLIKD